MWLTRNLATLIRLSVANAKNIHIFPFGIENGRYDRYTNEYAYMRIIPLESLLSLYAEPRCNARENCNAMVM